MECHRRVVLLILSDIEITSSTKYEDNSVRIQFSRAGRPNSPGAPCAGTQVGSNITGTAWQASQACSRALSE